MDARRRDQGAGAVPTLSPPDCGMSSELSSSSIDAGVAALAGAGMVAGAAAAGAIVAGAAAGSVAAGAVSAAGAAGSLGLHAGKVQDNSTATSANLMLFMTDPLAKWMTRDCAFPVSANPVTVRRAAFLHPMPPATTRAARGGDRRLQGSKPSPASSATMRLSPRRGSRNGSLRA